MKDISKDYFDCPVCGVKNVMYKIESEDFEEYKVDNTEGKQIGGIVPEWILYEVKHLILRCKRTACERLSYFKVIIKLTVPGTGLFPDELIFQYPADQVELPNYIPNNLRKYFKEAVEAFSFGLLNSASVMCRKVVYELCDKKAVSEDDYKQKISNLGLDKRITDPLLNIKNIGDETVHAQGWDAVTIGKAIEALRIILDMIYIQEERIKDFTKHYSKENQTRKQNET